MRLSELYSYINIAILIGVFLLAWFEYKKKRKPSYKPDLSFIVPCYNDGDSVWDTIKSIYESYDKKHIELVVIDDASTDDSYEVLKKLNHQYDFKLIKNDKNMGKVNTLNYHIPNLSNEIFVIIDADTKLNKKAIDDIISRFEHDSKVSAVSCCYKPVNKWFLPLMQHMEYTNAKVVWLASNHFKWASLVWGCMAVKKSDFEELGAFRNSALGEDFDIACRLIIAWKKIEQSHYSVESIVPDNPKWWIKQKLRRHGWFVQGILLNPKIIIKNLFFTFTLLGFVWININYMYKFYLDYTKNWLFDKISLVSWWASAGTLLIYNPLLDKLPWHDIIYYIYNLFDLSQTTIDDMSIIKIIFLLSTIIFVAPLIKNKKQIRKVLYIIPYVAIYLPIYGFSYIVGAIYGVYKYFTLRSTERWR